MDEDLQTLRDKLGNMEPDPSNLSKLINITMSCVDELQWLRDQIHNLREANNIQD